TPFVRTPIILTVPANTFVAGVTYRIELETNRLVQFDTTSTTGFAIVAAYSAISTINVVVSGPAAAPTFAAQPSSQTTVAPGSTVVVSAIVNGATTSQWRRDGVAIQGAQGPLLVLSGSGVVAGTCSL